MDEKRLLFSDERIKIYSADTPDEHEIQINGEDYCYMGRGILGELSRDSPKTLSEKLRNVNFVFHRTLSASDISFEEFGWALAKARIRELEYERDYYLDEVRTLGDRVDS